MATTTIRTHVLRALTPEDPGKGIDVRAAVLSSTGKKFYTVVRQRGCWKCSCPAWIYTSPRKNCKHVHEVIYAKAQADQMAAAMADMPLFAKAQ